MDERDYPEDWHHRRRRVYRRDGYACTNCGAKGGPHGDTELHAHHVVPKSEGGSDALDNLTTLCYECHNAVHDHHIPRQSDGDGLEPPASVVYEFDVDDPDAVRAAYVDDEIDEDEMERLLDDAVEVDDDASAREGSDSARDDGASAPDNSYVVDEDIAFADRSLGQTAVAFGAAMAVTVLGGQLAPLVSGGLLIAVAAVTVVASFVTLVTTVGLLNHLVGALATPRA